LGAPPLVVSGEAWGASGGLRALRTLFCGRILRTLTRWVVAQAQQGTGAAPWRDKTRPAPPFSRMCGTKLAQQEPCRAASIQNSPCTSRTTPLPVQNSPNRPLLTACAGQNSPCSPKMAQFGAFCPRMANFFTLAPTPGRAGRTFSHQHPTHTPDSELTYAIAASLANTHPLPNTVVPKTRTTTTARFQRFSPRQSALWAPHHPRPRSHHHQTVGMASLEAQHADDTPTASS